MSPPWRRAARLARVPVRAAAGRAREARWIVRAARAHGAPLPRVSARAARLRRAGWHVGDLAVLGLLDPREGPAHEGWAVARREILGLQESLNPAASVPAVDDKRLFADACRRTGLPAPRTAVVLERAVSRGETARTWAAALAATAPREMVVKPFSGELGVGVRVLRRAPGGVVDHRGEWTGWDTLARSLARGRHAGYLVQPRLRPHPSIARLSGRDDVLQCLRIITLLDGDGRARVVYAALRIAAGEGVVDSFRAPRSGSTGNLLARVLGDGTLAVPVGVAPGGCGLVRVAVHPGTGAVLAGAPVPAWDAARDLALRAAEAFAPLRTVGWDVAPTGTGPVLVEGNAWWGATGDPDGALLPVRAALREAAAALPAAG